MDQYPLRPPGVCPQERNGRSGETSRFQVVGLVAEVERKAQADPSRRLAVGLAAYTLGLDVRMPISGVACVVLVAGFWIAMLATDAPASAGRGAR